MDKNLILNKIKNKIIVSSQAQKNEPLYNEIAMNALIETIVVLGKTDCLRLAGARDVKNTKEKFGDSVVVIGITKPDIIPVNYKELVYITPNIEDANSLIEAGADIIAFDATKRERKTSVLELINFIHSKNKMAMADIAEFNEAKEAYELGADIISTTLSGYTKNTENTPDTPDFNLLQKCVKELKCPIILEGKTKDYKDVKHAFELGAYAVVIGSMVTRPHKIIEEFKKGLL
ncbi:TPA: putative N-acetylmannosamine-6-phosphate 2-epimerase [Candidatus Galligastranaerophilus intestinigallinarum]|nr:putative N-acetylmannosamine-6-phosphate 2-epimerase [Candidatus Galligastranaerophilus intestinigallinarum]